MPALVCSHCIVVEARLKPTWSSLKVPFPFYDITFELVLGAQEVWPGSRMTVIPPGLWRANKRRSKVEVEHSLLCPGLSHFQITALVWEKGLYHIHLHSSDRVTS